MSDLTTDRSHPDLNTPNEGQHKVYLVLSEEERAKGFVRPVRTEYVHLRTKDGGDPPRVITSMKDMVGCGTLTRMSRDIAETYARDPGFYSHTYCIGCGKHLPVAEFSWDADNLAVGS